MPTHNSDYTVFLLWVSFVCCASTVFRGKRSQLSSWLHSPVTSSFSRCTRSVSQPPLPAGTKWPALHSRCPFAGQKGREKLGVGTSPQKSFYTYTNAAWHHSIHWTRSGSPWTCGSTRPAPSTASPSSWSWDTGRLWWMLFSPSLGVPVCPQSGTPNTGPPSVQLHTSSGWMWAQLPQGLQDPSHPLQMHKYDYGW